MENKHNLAWLMAKDKYIIEDSDWADEISDVEPLKGRPKPHRRLDSYDVSDLKDDQEGSSSSTEQNLKHQTNLLEEEVGDYAPQNFTFSHNQPSASNLYIESNLSSKFAGYRGSIDGKIRKKLIRGEIPFKGVLDLHGFLENEAWNSLMDFINDSQELNNRCILIVHGKGKGYGEKGDMGIIKSRVCEWLASHPAVLAFHTAIPRHGGSGAVYVVLKKAR